MVGRAHLLHPRASDPATLCLEDQANACEAVRDVTTVSRICPEAGMPRCPAADNGITLCDCCPWRRCARNRPIEASMRRQLCHWHADLGPSASAEAMAVGIAEAKAGSQAPRTGANRTASRPSKRTTRSASSVTHRDPRATRTAGTRWSNAAAAAGDLGVQLRQQPILPGIIAPAAAASLISADWASRTACQVDGRRRGLATFAPDCPPR